MQMEENRIILLSLFCSQPQQVSQIIL